MNIFYLDSNPQKCAEWAVDKHVVKMILESAQLLSTAHRVLDGQRVQHRTQRGSRWCTRNVWNLHDNRQDILYAATHVNHPSAIWARQSNNNYNWLWCYLNEHCKEYTHRYGKHHKVEQDGLLERLMFLPANIPVGYKTQPPSAMDAKYVIPDTIEAYRKYYKYGKASLHSWKNREVPDWIKE